MWDKIIINGRHLSNNEQIIAWIIFAILCLVLVLSIGLTIMYIYYSWIKRNNSKDYDGKDITEYIFRKSNISLEIKKSLFYAKYWNHNKSKGTYKLRPWTYNRKSIWTIMEASQQAYATTIRMTKGKAFWFLFRIPFVLRILGAVLGGLFIYLGLKDFSNANSISVSSVIYFSLGITIVFLFYVIADCGRVFYLWRNVKDLIRDSGLNDYELKAINRIYFWRMIYSFVVVILEIIKMALQIASLLDGDNSSFKK